MATKNFSSTSLFNDPFYRYFTTDLSYQNDLPFYEYENTEVGTNIYLEAPGYVKEDISLEAENGVLKVEGKKTYTINGKEKSKSFKVNFQLRDFKDYEEITAKIENGILKISIPKLNKKETFKVNVE